MKVLIIEQEKTIQQSLSNFVEHCKQFEVFSAGSRREGASLFQSIPFDVVLCGDRLPDGDGLEMLKEWMFCRPNLISILMTVRRDESLKLEALRSGIRGYLEKPFDLKDLEEAMGVGCLQNLRPDRLNPNQKGGETK